MRDQECDVPILKSRGEKELLVTVLLSPEGRMYMSIQILKAEIQIRGMDKNNTSLILEEEMNSSAGWSVLSQKAAPSRRQ